MTSEIMSLLPLSYYLSYSFNQIRSAIYLFIVLVTIATLIYLTLDTSILPINDTDNGKQAVVGFMIVPLYFWLNYRRIQVTTERLGMISSYKKFYHKPLSMIYNPSMNLY
jgi:hypothetical protein